MGGGGGWQGGGPPHCSDNSPPTPTRPTHPHPHPTPHIRTPTPPHPTPPDLTHAQEVYGKLEEPDGLEGLVKLRLGGPRPEDQRLAAEKAGSWSEAATLYEQALQHGAGPGGVNNRAHGGAPAPAAGERERNRTRGPAC